MLLSIAIRTMALADLGDGKRHFVLDLLGRHLTGIVAPRVLHELAEAFQLR
jgi:hypothetical protein